MDLVIDTNVLVDASGEGMREYAAASYQLLQLLAERLDWRLCLDRKGRVRREYENRISGDMFALKWLQGTEERWHVPEPMRIPKPTRVQLGECHFDWSDLPFVETAYSTEDHLLITRDFNSYSAEVIRILRRDLDVRVLSPPELLTRFTQTPD